VRVALDGTPLIGTRTGVGAVAGALVDGLAARSDVDLVVYAVTGRSGLAPDVPSGVRVARRRWPARVVRWLWERTDVPRIEHWTGPVDVVHGTNFVAPPARARTVVTIHDLTFVRFPEMCTGDTLRYPLLIQRALARGAHVHVPSDFVGDEVATTYGVERDRITRVYSGVTAVTGGDPARGRVLADCERYVLALGTVEPRKNLPRLVEAFDAVAAADPDVALVVAGPDGWGADALTDAVRRASSGARVRRLGWVTADDRASLLAGATVFAYPSVYEGFGLPPLEAMSVGIPVVAGRAGALPEVTGDAALLADPTDVDALAGALDRALHDETARSELVARGRARVQRYRWSSAVDEMVALYRSLTSRSVA
jgi:glycosyltransferase involved in cell wall biosynthesis